VVATYDRVESKRGVRVVFEDLTLSAGFRVRGREGPLGQVVRNLIDNACSFSPEGGEVTVSLEQTRNGAEPRIRILVEDHGPGIPDDKLSQIFDRFYTDRPAGTEFGNNSGLGLSIVAQIVETHRGTVKAENRQSGGARFIVELPAT
jgi:two-component system sensor histidine kinase ChvG